MRTAAMSNQNEGGIVSQSRSPQFTVEADLRPAEDLKDL